MNYQLDKYQIKVSFKQLAELQIPEDQPAVFIIDQQVAALHPSKIAGLVQQRVCYYFQAKEENKSLEELTRIYDFFLQNSLQRDSLIIAIGGGITTDLVAYAASTFKRGCRLWLVPTTLLAMVDASVGGKSALNFRKIKNCLGTFYPAQQITIDLDFLATLDAKNSLAGWAEIVKTFLISGNEDDLPAGSVTALQPVIESCVQQKMQICQRDLYEKNERKLLNLGHSFAHVLESISENKIAHGLAVAMGMRLAARFSRQMGKISPQRFAAINMLLDRFGLPQYKTDYLNKISAEDLKEYLLQDKKFGKQPVLVLFSEQGVSLDYTCSLQDIISQFFLN